MKKSVGFNWGPSAVSTTYWTGFRLCDLLNHCGAKGPLEGARYVHFKGVEKELPQVRQLSRLLIARFNAFEQSREAQDPAPLCSHMCWPWQARARQAMHGHYAVTMLHIRASHCLSGGHPAK